MMRIYRIDYLLKIQTIKIISNPTLIKILSRNDSSYFAKE